MPTPLRFGIIGCGGFGREFAQYLLAVAEVSAVSDPVAENAAALAARYRLAVRQYTDYRRMLEAGGLDAVAITAPNFVHADAACAAADAGLHVYCEKPMARDVPECWRMVHAARRNHVKLMVGHKRRLRPPWARPIALTAGQLLGEPLSISVNQHADMRPYRYAGTWWSRTAQSGGLFHLHGVHVLDWFRAMCGDADSVSAWAGPKHDAGYEYPDIIHATFRFRRGALATLSSSMLYPLHKFRESAGPLGQCRHGGFHMVPHLDHIDLYWQRLDEPRPHHERFDDLGFDHAFGLEVGDFVRWVTEDRPPCLTWVEGLRCVEMMEAAYRSAESGGQPVAFPLYPQLEDGGGV